MRRLFVAFFIPLLIAGIVLDLTRVEVLGYSGIWVGIAFGISAVVLFASTILRLTTRGLGFAVFSTILSVMFLLLAFTDIKMATIYPLIPASVSLSLLVFGLITYHDRSSAKLGLVGTIISLGLLLGSLWSYIACGVFIIIVATVWVTIKFCIRKNKYEIPRISIIERAKKLKEEGQNEKSKFVD